MMPLEGIRVVDWTVMQQGPVATMILGALGAEVFKLEEPVRGDPLRGMTTVYGIPVMLPGGREACFENHNRNKKGIVIDLKKPEGKEVMYRLVEKSDIFAHNMTKRVAEKLGMDYQTLLQYNPKLIYGNATGYGPKGPLSEKLALDYTAQARAGMMFHMRESEDGAPVPPITGMADECGALCFAMGLLTALCVRERTGRGQEVSSSLFGSTIAIQRYNLAMHLSLQREFPRAPREKRAPLQNHYRCKDGRWIALDLIQSQRYWAAFCRALGAPGLEDDPKFKNADEREKNHELLTSILDKIFATKTYEECEKGFQDAGILLYGPVCTIYDLASDPQVVANDYIVEFNDPVMGPSKVVGLPFQLSETPWTIRTPAPEFGQHTEEVLSEVLGYTWEQIAQLREKEVF